MGDITNCITDDVLLTIKHYCLSDKDIIEDSICKELDIYIKREIIDDYRVLSLSNTDSSVTAEILITISAEYSDEELLTITYEVDNAPF